MFTVESVHKFWSIKNKWCKTFEINGKRINFKLDSGGEINTLTEKDFNYLGIQMLIKNTKVTLQVYVGFKMKPIREIKTVLTLDDKNIETEFIVTEKAHKNRAIIGPPILTQLKFIKM